MLEGQRSENMASMAVFREEVEQLRKRWKGCSHGLLALSAWVRPQIPAVPIRRAAFNGMVEMSIKEDDGKVLSNNSSYLLCSRSLLR
jgi:hypothetical protein